MTTMRDTTLKLSADEAEALFEAAEVARKHHWFAGPNQRNMQLLMNLRAATAKLRRADTLIVERGE